MGLSIQLIIKKLKKMNHLDRIQFLNPELFMQLEKMKLDDK